MGSIGFVGVLQHVLEVILEDIVGVSVIFLELIGVVIVIWTALVGFYKYLKRQTDTKLYLGEGFAMGLQFKLGSEILRTVVIKEWSEIIIVGGIIALRVALAFLIHWENDHEEKHAQKQAQKLEKSVNKENC